MSNAFLPLKELLLGFHFTFCFVLAMAVAPAKSQVDVTLLKLESDPMMLYGAGITTVQFYEGDLEQGPMTS